MHDWIETPKDSKVISHDHCVTPSSRPTSNIPSPRINQDFLSFPFPFLLLACFLNFFLLSAIVRWNRRTHDLGQLVFLILFSPFPSSWMTLAATTLATTQLTKVLHQGSRLLLNKSDNKRPPTPSSLTKLDCNSAAWGESGDKAESERMGNMAPAQGVSREGFFYWHLDLLFLICSDTSKGRSVLLYNIH
jgi:hypothetical protein